MCGRFVRKCSLDEIKDEFDVFEIQWAWEPSYNVAPGQDIAGIINDGKNVLTTFRWGLIPWWAKEESIGYKMINARAETVAQKRSFSRAFKKQRCLVVADGFYEWRKLADGKRKVPMYVHLHEDRPFGFAGLYENWKGKDGTVLQTCTIITTQPNELMIPIHNRMPVIIAREQRKVWLDKEIDDPGILMPMLSPYAAKDMDAYEVSKKVNSPSYNEPDCIRPAKEDEKQQLGFT